MTTILITAAIALALAVLGLIGWALNEARPFTISLEDTADMPNQHTQRHEYTPRHRIEDITNPYRPRPPVVSGGPLSSTERRGRMLPLPLGHPGMCDADTAILDRPAEPAASAADGPTVAIATIG